MKREGNGSREPSRARFTEAVAEHGKAMFRAARAILDGDADAEDAVGEAVLRAWQSYGTLREDGAMRAWLLKITVNCAYAQRRKLGRITYTDDMERYQGGTVAEATGEGLWDAVCRLPRDHRVAVTLFYYEDMPLAEIAAVLGVRQGTVKSRLCRARKRLKELLGEEEME